MNNDFLTAVRFPSEVVDRLDAIAQEMSKEKPGMKVTRAAVIRMMVMKALEQTGSKTKVKKLKKVSP